MFTWYLVAIANGMYVGPMPIQNCVQAEKQTISWGVVCKQATVMMLCPVPDHPNAYTTCPKFDFPQVTVKP